MAIEEQKNMATIEWVLRVIESIAFSIHGILGITEPCTGCLRMAFGDNGAMPTWFWPLAGIILWIVAIANFSKNGSVVLGAQAYIAAFHMGAVFYHLRLGHHQVVGIAPGMFVVLFAFVVVTLRVGVVLAFVGLFVCTAIAFVLSRILVTPPSTDTNDERQQQGAYLLSP